MSGARIGYQRTQGASVMKMLAHGAAQPRTMHYLDANPDFRRDPKTAVYCWRCQKDLKPNQPRRYVHIINGGDALLHPDSENAYVSDAGDCGCFPVGMDCARKIGLEWTFEMSAVDPTLPTKQDAT